MASRLFLDNTSAQKFLGMSEKQFTHAVARVGIRPFTFPRVLHTTKQFWLRTVLQENRKALIACIGQRGRPKKQGPRPGGNFASR